MMLHETFKKKAAVVGKNIESMKKYKNEMNIGMEALEDRIIKMESVCN